MQKTMSATVAALVLLLVTLGCAESKKATTPIETSDKLQFTVDPAGQPVISSGTAGWPMFPSDPGVLKDDEGYHLFYTTLFCKHGGDYYYSWDSHNLGDYDLSDVVGTIGYAFSADSGCTWEFRGSPVILPGPEDWQAGDLETSFPIVVESTLYLFYSALGARDGAPFENRYQIGVATLPLNGASIRQRLLLEGAMLDKRSQPVLPYNTSSVSFDNNTQEPSAVYRDSRLELYYVGVSFSHPDEAADAPGQELLHLGMAKAVFDPNLNMISNSSDYILSNANITEVRYIGGTYVLFSTGMGSGEFHRNEYIDYYTSTDGEKWSAQGALLSTASGGSFTNWGVMAPTVAEEDESIMMFFTGWSIEDQQCFPDPFPPSVRFGRPSLNDTECIYGSVGRAVSVRPTSLR